MNFDQFFGRRYHAARYNCVHFAVDIWKHVTGQDLSGRMEIFAAQPSTTPTSTTPVVNKRGHTFKRILQPVTPCFVLVNWADGRAHLGVHLNGKMIHLNHPGVEFLPLALACRGSKRTRFYV